VWVSEGLDEGEGVGVGGVKDEGGGAGGDIKNKELHFVLEILL
jgi:hypothetical protein